MFNLSNIFFNQSYTPIGPEQSVLSKAPSTLTALFSGFSARNQPDPAPLKNRVTNPFSPTEGENICIFEKNSGIKYGTIIES